MQAGLALREVTLTKTTVCTPLPDLANNLSGAGPPAVAPVPLESKLLRQRELTGAPDGRVGLVFDGQEEAANSGDHFANAASRCASSLASVVVALWW